MKSAGSESASKGGAAQKPTTSDWGLSGKKSGLRRETKIGLLVVIGLAVAFAVVVFQRLQHGNELPVQSGSDQKGPHQKGPDQKGPDQKGPDQNTRHRDNSTVAKPTGDKNPSSSGSGTITSKTAPDGNTRRNAAFPVNPDDDGSVRTVQTEPRPSGGSSGMQGSTASSTTNADGNGGDGNPFHSHNGHPDATTAKTAQYSRTGSGSSDFTRREDNPFGNAKRISRSATSTDAGTNASTNGKDDATNSPAATTQSDGNPISPGNTASPKNDTGANGDGGNPFFVANSTSGGTGKSPRTDASNHTDGSRPVSSNTTQTTDDTPKPNAWDFDGDSGNQRNTDDGHAAAHTGGTFARSSDASSGQSSPSSRGSDENTTPTLRGGTSRPPANAVVDDPTSGAKTANSADGNGPSMTPVNGDGSGQAATDDTTTTSNGTATTAGDADSSPRPLFAPGHQPASKQLPRDRDMPDNASRGTADSRLGGYRVGSGGSARAKSTTTVQTAGSSDDLEYPFGKPDNVKSDDDDNPAKTDANTPSRSNSSTSSSFGGAPFGQQTSDSSSQSDGNSNSLTPGKTTDTTQQRSPVGFPADSSDSGTAGSGRSGNRMSEGNPIRAGDNPRVYSVQNGDNYWGISRKAYGTPKYFQALATYNRVRIPDPKKLRPGMKVLVPDAAVLKERFPKLCHVSRKSAGTDAEQPPGFFRNRSGQPRYRVGKSDTLGSIAQKHLGRASRWIQIYQMNRDRIKNPNRLKIGTELRLPADASRIQVVRRPQGNR